MERHFDQELEDLKMALLRMAGRAEEQVAQALQALTRREDARARKVEADDNALDDLQVEIDDRCIKLLALRQPAAKDLRFVMMATKIATDLERIGDLAVNIAQEAERLNREPPLKPLVDIPRMAEIAQGMIRDTLDAFVNGKPDTARQIIARDDEVDSLNRQIHRELTSFMIEDPHTVTRALSLMTVAQNLERVGDHVTNVAEEIIFLYEARDVRHQHE